MTRAALIAALLATFPLVAATRAQYLMGTVCEIAADVPAEAAFAETARIESIISTWRDDSELSRVNRGEQPSAELRALLEVADAYVAKTGGAFNPHIRSLLNEWGIRRNEEGSGRVSRQPTTDSRQPDPSPTPAVGCRLPAVDTHASAPLSGSLDYEEGAFAKGYAIDRMLDVLAKQGARNAVINFGGQIGTLTPITVTIADPMHRDKPVVSLTLEKRSLSTSSGSEKTFMRDGRIYSHIVDPRTREALPPRGSVSVISDSALEADILSTALYVMGREQGLAWARAHNVIAIFIDNGSIEASAAISGISVLDAHFRIRGVTNG